VSDFSREFGGVIGDTVAESTPWWPDPVRAPAGSPNIVVIVLDDVGFADLGCYGSEIATPHIDAIAARGLRFTNFHTTAVCSASRACLLTGRNHHSVGMGSVSNWDTGFPGTRGRVARSAGNLAEILRPSGYASFAVGKWHLTQMREASHGGPFEHWPLRRGFDRFYGFFDGANNWHPSDLVHDNHRVLPPDTPDYHLTGDLVDRSIEFIRDQVSVYPEKPFFLYFCPFACHCPYQAPRAFVDRQRGRYDRGWDVLRAERLERQKAMGIVPRHTELPPRNPDVKAWEDLSDDERAFTARIYESYAAMLEHTDDEIGRLVSFIDAIGKRDDTMIVVVSDNGATREGGSLGDVNWYRSANVMPLGAIDAQRDQLDAMGGPTTAPVNATGWSMVGNTPLKRYKGNTHGGGIRDPLIVSWPARLADHGGLRSQFCHIVDVLPTLIEVVGLPLPATIDGVEQQPIEGMSLAACLTQPDAPTPKSVQYFEMHGSRGIWRDGWKAVTFHVPNTPFADDQWELYHLDRDVGECHDVAADHRELLESLVDAWWQEARKYAVLPLDDRILERFLVRPPNPVTDRHHFTYLRGVYVPTEAMPDVRNVSFEIRATIDRVVDVDNGVLAACGDALMGYALYVKDGFLRFHYNAAGTHSAVSSTSPLPLGPQVVSFVFVKTGPLRGTGLLFTGDDEIGTGPIGPTIGVTFAPLGLSIGMSRASPVTTDYEGRFPFTGKLTDVVFVVGDDRDQTLLPTYMND
jgi:arylsulfatase